MIVVINGPPGVGKTTASNALAQLLPRCICIHGDDLRAFAPDDARSFLGGGSTYRAAATLARAYLEMGAEFVLFDYCFLRPRHLAYFTDALPGVEVQVFTLWAELQTVQAREAQRPRPPLGDAVEECHREMAEQLGVLGEIVDADSRSAPNVAVMLLGKIQQSAEDSKKA